MSQPAVTTPMLASPQTPALSSTILVPLSSISNLYPDMMKSLTVIKTPSGPAIQTCLVGTAQPLETKSDTTTMTTAVNTGTILTSAVTETSEVIPTSSVSSIALPTSLPNSSEHCLNHCCIHSSCGCCAAHIGSGYFAVPVIPVISTNSGRDNATGCAPVQPRLNVKLSLQHRLSAIATVPCHRPSQRTPYHHTYSSPPLHHIADLHVLHASDTAAATHISVKSPCNVTRTARPMLQMDAGSVLVGMSLCTKHFRSPNLDYFNSL